MASLAATCLRLLGRFSIQWWSGVVLIALQFFCFNIFKIKKFPIVQCPETKSLTSVSKGKVMVAVSIARSGGVV